MTWRPLLELPARILVPLLVVLFALIMAMLIAGLHGWTTIDTVTTQERLRLQERLAVEQTRHEVQGGLGNQMQVSRLVTGLALHQGVSHAWLVDAEQRVLASLSRREIGQPLSEVLMVASAPLRTAVLAAMGAADTGVRVGRIAGEPALLGQVPVHPDYQLLVRADLSLPLALHRYHKRRELLIETGSLLGLSLLLAALLHRLWFRRTARLTDTVAAIAAGNLAARADLTGRDELAAIGTAIDHMASQLQRQGAELQLLADLIDRSPVVVIVWRNTPGWPVAYISDNCRQWGYRSNELAGGALTFADLIHPDDRQRIEVEVARHIAEGPDEYLQHYRVRHAEGRWLWMEDRTWLDRDAGGRVIALHGLLLDATELRQNEQALRQQKERLEQAEDQAGLGSWEFDPASGQGWWSPQMFVLFGLPVADEPPDFATYLSRIHPDDQTLVRSAMAALTAGCLPIPMPYRSHPASGPLRWYRPTVHRLEDGSGALGHFSGTVLDITALKQAEEDAEWGRILLDRVFEVLPDLFFLMAADGTILDYKARDSRDLYLQPAYFLGRRMQHVLPEDVVGKFIHGLNRALRGQLTRFDYALSMPGGVRQFEARLGQLPDTDRVMAVVRDITDLKAAEAEVLRLNADLEQRVQARTAELVELNKELETFTYSVSHDLKAPLRGIDGYSRLLLEDYAGHLDAEGQQFLRNVCHGVAQMNELIEDLLAYSRMERHSIEPVEVDLRSLCGRLLAERQDELDARGVEVLMQLDDTRLTADPDGLQIILRNLIDNALKFTVHRNQPRLEITASAQSGAVRLSVTDNGIGFDLRFKDRIFDIFQRLQRAEDYPGTGIGLALVRRAMQRMGGRVWAEGQPDQGATFHLEFPQ